MLRMTAIEALGLAAAGKWNEAWVVAQLDDGLLPHVTFEQWKSWALDRLARNED